MTLAISVRPNPNCAAVESAVVVIESRRGSPQTALNASRPKLGRRFSTSRVWHHNGAIANSRLLQPLEEPRPRGAAEEFAAPGPPAATALPDFDGAEHHIALLDAEGERGAEACDVLRLQRHIHRVARLPPLGAGSGAGWHGEFPPSTLGKNSRVRSPRRPRCHS